MMSYVIKPFLQPLSACARKGSQLLEVMRPFPLSFLGVRSNVRVVVGPLPLQLCCNAKNFAGKTAPPPSGAGSRVKKNMKKKENTAVVVAVAPVPPTANNPTDANDILLPLYIAAVVQQ